ncbi:hypothetical protein L208DRAFT_1278111, partial [Tricholoma matsutake]
AFDPTNESHIANIETDNSLPPCTITSASWLKHIDCQGPNQTVASLKVVCSSPEFANQLLGDCIYITGHVVTVHKDLCKPIHCNKCQGFGHI